MNLADLFLGFSESQLQ